MPTRTEELELFKTRINLTEYAASQGYVIRRKKSYGSSVVMTAGSDIVVIGKNAANGHWIYWQVDAGKGSPAEDSGSIIDFVQHRTGGSLGQVRKELRPWISGSHLTRRPARASYVVDLKPITKDLMRVQADVEAALPVKSHPFLEQHRSIPAAVIAEERFEGRIRCDNRGNAVFPHLNRDGICGAEIKNVDFTSFSSGGEKGLWASRVGESDTTLVIAETAIDALSYHAIHRPEDTRYVSTGGALNAVQPGLIQSAIQKMPEKSRIIVAVDQDSGGKKLFDRIKALFDDLGRAECVLIDGRPPGSGKDWNDVLRASKSKKAFPANTPQEPSA